MAVIPDSNPLRGIKSSLKERLAVIRQRLLQVKAQHCSQQQARQKETAVWQEAQHMEHMVSYLMSGDVILMQEAERWFSKHFGTSTS